MIDLNQYPNINVICQELGGIKQSVFNKKMMAEAEEGWSKVTPELLARINQEAPTAKKVMNCYVMPSGILLMMNRVFYVIPFYDIIWIYGYILKNSMNFIPTYKDHSLHLVTRNGNTLTLGSKTTMALSKKDPCGDAIQEIMPVFAQTRSGILYGYSDEIANAVQNNFAGVVQTVDARCQGQQ